MRIAHLSPLPPVRSGIAGYSASLLPHLKQLGEITAVVEQPEPPRLGIPMRVISFAEFRRRFDSFDAFICQLGNNPHHEFVYRFAMEHPSIIVLHDLVLHHLIVELTLARGEPESYVETLRENHGEAGAAWARGRLVGLHEEIGNFLYPASIEIANRSRAVIVHNRYAAERLEELALAAPVEIVGHLFDETTMKRGSRSELRQRSGYSAGDHVIGMFGFVTNSKRPEVVFEAFSRAFARDSRLRLLIVGEPAPNVDLSALASRFEIPESAWRATGYASDSDFDEALDLVDAVVNLRYPSAGETSGALVRIFAFGKRVAVSDYAQFAELASDVVEKIPFGDGEVQAVAEFMLPRAADPALALRQRAWLREHASPAAAVAGYARALERARLGERTAIQSSPRVGIPLFPSLALSSAEVTRDEHSMTVHLELENTGGETIRTSELGSAGYRLIANLCDTSGEVASQWLTLSRDVAPGQRCLVDVVNPRPRSRSTLELVHALSDVPVVDPAPFAQVEIEE